MTTPQCLVRGRLLFRPGVLMVQVVADSAMGLSVQSRPAALSHHGTVYFSLCFGYELAHASFPGQYYVGGNEDVLV